MQKYIKRFLILLTIFVTTLYSSFVYAQEGMVVSVGLGTNIFLNKEISTRYQGSYNNYSSKASLSFVPRLSVGYEFYNMGFEISVSNYEDSIKHSGNSLNSLSEKSRVKFATVNAFYKFNTYTDFVPFIGGGYGLYLFNGTLTNDITNHEEKIKQKKYMFSFMVGVTYNFTDSLSMGLMYNGYHILNNHNDASYFKGVKYVNNNINLLIKYYLN